MRLFRYIGYTLIAEGGNMRNRVSCNKNVTSRWSKGKGARNSF